MAKPLVVGDAQIKKVQGCDPSGLTHRWSILLRPPHGHPFSCTFVGGAAFSEKQARRDARKTWKRLRKERGFTKKQWGKLCLESFE